MNSNPSSYDKLKAVTIENSYLKIIPLLTIRLNNIHSLHYPEWFWEIVVGSWLIHFLSFYYDSLYEYKFSAKELLTDNNSMLSTIYSNLGDFLLRIRDPDHRMIYLKDLDFIKNRFFTASLAYHEPYRFKSFLCFFNNILDSVISILLSVSNQKLFIIDSFLNPTDKFKLLLRFNSLSSFLLPRLIRFRALSNTVPNILMRDLLCIPPANDDDFINCVLSILPYCLPTFFVESFAEVLYRAKKVDQITTNKLVLTLKSHLHDDFLRLFIALKKLKGSKWFICQHGGHYGSGFFNHFEYYEKRVCNYFFTFGWSDAELCDKKTLRLGLPIYWRKCIRKAFPQKLLIVLSDYCYGYTMIHCSWPTFEDLESYYSELRLICKRLCDILPDQVTIRLPQSKIGYGFDIKSYFEHYDLGRYFDSAQNMSLLYSEASVVLHTSNTTSFLETLFLDIPTSVYLNPKYWPLRSDSLSDFDSLNECGVVQLNSDQAVERTLELFNNQTLWHNPRISFPVSRFKNKYCLQNTSLHKDLEFFLKNL